MAGGWRKHFAEPAPEGWVPKRGETVRVKPIKGTLARLVSTGVVMSVADDLVRVKLCYGRQMTMGQFLIDDIRPIKKGRRAGSAADSQ